jgi:transcription initiation factor TFIIH subunit 1
MWEPNEQLLLRAPVRYKKQDGTLFVTPRRVAYQQQGSSQLTPSIYYNNIAGKKNKDRCFILLLKMLLLGLAQTPESSPKVLLKISLKTAGAKDYTFQFTSAKNIQEREGIKSQIAELLARARGSSVTAATTTTTTPATTPATPLSTTTTTSTPSPTPTTTQQSSAISSPATIAKSPLPSNGSSVPGSPRSARQEEFNDRKALLTSSKELQTLHKELVVVGKSVDEEEFWASPYVKRIRQVKANK